MPEHPVRSRSGNGHPDVAIVPSRDEHTGHRVARCRIGELLIGSLGRRFEADGGDDLAVLQRCFEQAGEEIICRNLALVGHDRRTERQHRRRIIGRRVVVGDGTADRAHVPHMRVADMAGKAADRRTDGFERRRRRHVIMCRGGADPH
ncbi:hypothetical protein D9M72_511380 [compost metagenome]